MSLKKSDLGTHVVPLGFKSLVTIPFFSFRISQEKKFDGFGFADTLSKPWDISWTKHTQPQT